MALFDMPLTELESYLPARNEPADFDTFWAATLAETRRHPLNAQFTPYASGLHALEVFDVSFHGYGGQAVRGWLLLPRRRGSSSQPRTAWPP